MKTIADNQARVRAVYPAACEEYDPWRGWWGVRAGPAGERLAGAPTRSTAWHYAAYYAALDAAESQPKSED